MVTKQETEQLEGKLNDYIHNTSQDRTGDVLLKYLFDKSPNTSLDSTEKASLTGAFSGGYRKCMKDIESLLKDK